MIPVLLGIFVAGQAIADYALAPYLIASRVHLNPVWVMFAVAAFGYLFGFVGLLIAFVIQEGARMPASLPAPLRRVVRFLVPYTRAGWAFAVLSPRAAARRKRARGC